MPTKKTNVDDEFALVVQNAEENQLAVSEQTTDVCPSKVSRIVSMGTSMVKGLCGLGRKVDRKTGFEHHIAMFGESGSGKTTLLNVFYGYQQSAVFSQSAKYQLVSEDVAQGNQLLTGYNKLQYDGETEPTRLKATSYSFSVIPTEIPQKVMRFVWHDYPGEWLTQDGQTPAERERRKETLVNLAQSNTAFLLVDASKLKTQGGRYIKRLFDNLKNEFVRMTTDLLEEGKDTLAHFPRIWFIALSKADLMPECTVEAFKDMVYKYAFDELTELERTINRVIPASKFLDVKSDFILLSSAKFDPDSYKLLCPDQILGIDAVVPLSAFEPVQRALRWGKIRGINARTLTAILKSSSWVLEKFGDIVKDVGTVGLGWIPFVGFLFSGMGVAVKGALNVLAVLPKMTARATQSFYEKSLKDKDALNCLLALMKLRLDVCKKQHIIYHAPKVAKGKR